MNELHQLSADAVLRSAAPPLHRVERVIERQAEAAGGDQLRVLTALRPELGWPRAWAWLPVREDAQSGRYLPLQPDRPLREQAHLQVFAPQPGEPGDALRSSLPLAWVPAEAGCGLLCLFVYADEREQRVEGVHDKPDLETALRKALAADMVALRHAFVTRPATDPDAGALSFVFTACQFPPGLLDHLQGAEREPRRAGPADASLARLVALTRAHAAGAEVSLLLLAGDQIYADSSGGVADAANSVDRYALPYRSFKAGLARHLPSTLERIVHAPDDHEIVDNWEPTLRSDGSWDHGPWAKEAFAAAWAARWEPGAREGLFEHFWHQFDWRGASFFIGDTRTEREPRPLARLLGAQIMGAAQREAFAQWLARSTAAGRPRFVLTGSLLLPRRLATAEHAASALHSDAWDGYPASLHWLLGELWLQRASNVVFLSGDEHRSGYVSATISRADGSEPERTVQLHSIHSSALYAPWPFAVTQAEEFAAPERFVFAGPDGVELSCSVSAWADHPGDGFALLRRQGDALALWFDRAGRALHESSGGLPAPDGLLPLLD